MDSYKCDEKGEQNGCSQFGWWINGRYGCKNHYEFRRIPVEAKESAAREADAAFGDTGARGELGDKA